MTKSDFGHIHALASPRTASHLDRAQKLKIPDINSGRSKNSAEKSVDIPDTFIFSTSTSSEYSLEESEESISRATAQGQALDGDDQSKIGLVNSRYSVIYLIFLGQFLSLCITSTAVTSGLLVLKNAQFPMFMAWCNCLVLSIFYGWGMACHRLTKILKSLQNFFGYRISSSVNSEEESIVISGGNLQSSAEYPWLKYITLSILDLEANTAILFAYKYTSVISVMLLDAFAIPSVMIVGYLLSRSFPGSFLSNHYVKQFKSFWAITGVAICLAGLLILLFEDSKQGNTISNDDSSEASFPLWWLGDLLTLLGAFLYSLSNLLQEHLVRSRPLKEVLGSLGIYGSIFGGLQLIITGELWEVLCIHQSKCSSPFLTVFSSILVILFTSSLFLIYTQTPKLLASGSAVLLNLSLLSADAYGAAIWWLLRWIGIVNSGSGNFDWIYLIGGCVVVAGVTIYCIGVDRVNASQQTDEANGSDYVALQQENVVI